MCGFDSQMLDGLDMFHRGLAYSIIRRARKVEKMPFCGFDEQMLDGLDKFHRGLADSITSRTVTTFEAAIEQELTEMDEFIEELQKLDDGLNKMKLIGLANYAKSFYEGALQRSRTDHVGIDKAMESEMKDTRSFLYEVDRLYYEDLKGKVPEPIKKLVEYIGGK